MEFKAAARPSPIAGTWYTSDPNILGRQIDDFIDQAKVSDDEISGRIIGLVSPHAGHRYSGKTAGYAFRTIKGEKRNLVVLLSPLHQYFSGDLITTPYNTYETPLGEIPVDTELLNKLELSLSERSIRIHQIERDTEHSLEIQLPFLQRALAGSFQLLPLMVRSRDPILLKKAADSLHMVIKDESFLLVASTDLSHFFPLHIAEVMDAEMLKRIKEMDPEGVLNAEKDGSGAACGASAVVVMLWAAKKAGAEVRFADENRLVVHDFKGQRVQKWLTFKDFLEVDKFINVPILKHHGSSGLTIGMKNLFGILGGRRGKLHRNMGASIADLANGFKIHLTVVDAFRVMKRNGPVGGRLSDVELKKTVIASSNIMEADVVATTVFGTDPAQYPFIQEAATRKMGKDKLNLINLKSITI